MCVLAIGGLLLGTLTVQLIHPPAAHATETSGYVYQSSNSDCAYYDDQMYGTPGGFSGLETDASYAYSYFGEFTITCATPYDRPPGEVAVLGQWYENDSLCAYTDYFYNQSTSASVEYVYDGNIATLCGNNTAMYTLLGDHYEYNGAWHGGQVYPAATQDGS